MKHCLDATCNGFVELLKGKQRCNSCGIVQDERTFQNFNETLDILDKPKRTETELEVETVRHDF